jgi:predicted membrane channel-forming protein YqfA (hemolysin III family)
MAGASRAIAARVVTDPQPSARKAVGIALIMLLILIWAAFVASLSQVVGKWPVLVQAAFYLIMGIAWIIPLKPLIRWSQTGRWGKPSGPAD